MSSNFNSPRVVFCGLVRDAKRQLARHQKLFRYWETEFPGAHWIWVENDSKDGTRALLDNWAANNPRVHVIGENSNERTIPRLCANGVHPAFSSHRITRMAMYRNLYIEYLEKNFKWDEFDKAVVLDADVFSLPRERLVSVLRDPGEVVVTAFGRLWDPDGVSRFYDTYAHEDLPGGKRFTVEGIAGDRASLTRRYEAAATPYEVSSNFNALAIYPYEAIVGGRYMMESNDDPLVECLCEHVGFHRRIRAKGFSIVVDPFLVVKYNRRWPVMLRQRASRIKKFLMRQWSGWKSAKSVPDPQRSVGDRVADK